jgi:hypothetical protein
MLQIEGGAYGELSAVRAESLNNHTRDGWKLIAVVPDMTLVEFQEDDPTDQSRGYDRRQIRRKEHQPVSWFVLGRTEEDVIQQLRYELSEANQRASTASSEKYDLERQLREKDEEAQKTKEMHDEVVADLKRRFGNVQREHDRYEKLWGDEKEERKTLFDSLKSLLGDEDVNDAVLAAITVSESPTAKQMIVDLMRLREKLGIKTKDGDK